MQQQSNSQKHFPIFELPQDIILIDSWQQPILSSVPSPHSHHQIISHSQQQPVTTSQRAQESSLITKYEVTREELLANLPEIGKGVAICEKTRPIYGFFFGGGLEGVLLAKNQVTVEGDQQRKKGKYQMEVDEGQIKYNHEENQKNQGNVDSKANNQQLSEKSSQNRKEVEDGDE